MRPSANNLEHLMKCPVCDRNYNHTRALILEEEVNKTAFHVTCESCKISTIVLISSNNFGLVSLGILTDLDRNEAKRLYKNDAISSNQVIELHQFLKEFDGGVKEFI